MSIIAIFVVLITAVSAGSNRDYIVAEGKMAPKIQVDSSDGSPVSLSDYAGRYVLLNFWASTDAPSRIAAIQYNDMAQSMKNQSLSLVSINFDTNERLFREIVRRDDLDNESQFSVHDSRASHIIRDYGMDGGLQSYLIDPSGRIVAVNPDVNTVKRLINRQPA